MKSGGIWGGTLGWAEISTYVQYYWLDVNVRTLYLVGVLNWAIEGGNVMCKAPHLGAVNWWYGCWCVCVYGPSQCNSIMHVIWLRDTQVRRCKHIGVLMWKS